MDATNVTGAALLIGNARYEATFGSLRTPLNDIENLGDRFRAIGFETYVVPDADRTCMGMALSQFGKVVASLPEKSSVFFYFAGHGLQRSGENFLIPIDARGSDEAELLWSCVRLTDVLAAFCGRADQQKWIALDACRSNRIPSLTRDGVAGLAGDSAGRYEGVRETTVLYATEPGQVALDGASHGSSPFCRGLLDALTDPGQPLPLLTARVTQFVCRVTNEMQVPWGTGNLRALRPFVPTQKILVLDL
jgi:uncharacterized caspase-like protein